MARSADPTTPGSRVLLQKNPLSKTTFSCGASTPSNPVMWLTNRKNISGRNGLALRNFMKASRPFFRPPFVPNADRMLDDIRFCFRRMMTSSIDVGAVLVGVMSSHSHSR